MIFPTFASMITLGLLVTTTTARIVAIKPPTTIKAGHGKTTKVTVQVRPTRPQAVTLTHKDLQTENYIQTNADYSIVWGYRASGTQCTDCLGTTAGFTDLVCVSSVSLIIIDTHLAKTGRSDIAALLMAHLLRRSSLQMRLGDTHWSPW